MKITVRGRLRRVSEKIDTIIVFENRGSQAVRFPLMDTAKGSVSFFDVLILGDFGESLLVSHGAGWINADEKPIVVHTLEPGKSFKIRIPGMIPSDIRKNLSSFPGEALHIYAIYRDRAHGHQRPYKGWRGVLISSPAVIPGKPEQEKAEK